MYDCCIVLKVYTIAQSLTFSCIEYSSYNAVCGFDSMCTIIIL